MNPLSSISPLVDGTGSLIDVAQNPLSGPGASGAPAPRAPSAPQAPGTQANGSVASGGDFLQTLTNAVGGLSNLQGNADQALSGLALNQGVDIHQAMLAMEQASLGMNLAVQVRDKAVEAYQTLMNMQF